MYIKKNVQCNVKQKLKVQCTVSRKTKTKGIDLKKYQNYVALIVSLLKTKKQRCGSH